MCHELYLRGEGGVDLLHDKVRMPMRSWPLTDLSATAASYS